MNRPSFAAAAADSLDDVYRYLLMLTADPALADDLTGTTFEKALTRWRRYDPERGSPTPWLCAIARNVALDHFRSEARRRRREDLYAAGAAAASADAVDLGVSPDLEAALGELSAAEREVVALRVVLDLDAETAARVLGISRTACSMRLARGLQKLEERMNADALA